MKGFGEEVILGGFCDGGELGLRDFWERGRLFCFVERELLFEEGILVVGVEFDEVGGVNLLVFNCDLVLFRVVDLEFFFELVFCCGVFVLLVDFFLEVLEEFELDVDVVELF